MWDVDKKWPFKHYGAAASGGGGGSDGGSGGSGTTTLPPVRFSLAGTNPTKDLTPEDFDGEMVARYMEFQMAEGEELAVVMEGKETIWLGGVPVLVPPSTLCCSVWWTQDKLIVSPVVSIGGV